MQLYTVASVFRACRVFLATAALRGQSYAAVEAHVLVDDQVYQVSCALEDDCVLPHPDTEYYAVDVIGIGGGRGYLHLTFVSERAGHLDLTS